MQSFRAQAHLRCTMDGVMEEIKKECGLVGFIVVGGPEPQCRGDLMIMSCVLSASCVAAIITYNF
jgi:hypothetical protein